jgi:hypothetical protein
MEIAAHCGNGIRAASGHKMEKRFLLYRINMLGTEPPVYQAVEGTAMIFPDKANSLFSFTDQACESAKAAANASVGFPRIKHSLFHNNFRYQIDFR